MTPEDRRRIAAAVEAARGRRPDLDPDAFAFLQCALTPDLAEGPAGPPRECLEFPAAGTAVHRPGDGQGARGHRALSLQSADRAQRGRLPPRPACRQRCGVPCRERRAAGEDAPDDADDLDPRYQARRGRPRPDRRDSRATPGSGTRRSREWHALLADPAQPVDRNEEYFFYQLLLGAWPAEWRRTDEIATEDLQVFADRVTAAMLKSSREAGVNTRWTFGDARYEAALAAFVGRALAPESQLPAVLSGLRGDGRRGRHRDLARADRPEAHRSRRAGHLPGRGILGAEHGRPGQPSSRRFPASANLLEAPLSSAAGTDPFAKFEITRRLLKLRQSNPRLFAEGSYQPLSVDGPGAEAVCAFARLNGDAGLVVAVTLHGAEALAGEARIALPRHIRGPWVPVLPGEHAVHGTVATVPRSSMVVLYADGRMR